jgi:bacterial/archaeal transporter family protein
MESNLIFFSLIFSGAFLIGTIDFLKKLIYKGAYHKLPTEILVGVTWFSAGVILILFSPLFIELAWPPEVFWLYFSISLVLNVLAQNLEIKSIKLEDISLVTPIKLLSSPLVILTGLIFLKELPSVLGLIGFFLALFGFYLLAVSSNLNRKSFPKSFERPGVQHAILASILLSVVIVFAKKSLDFAPTYFFVMLTTLGIGIASITLSFFRKGYIESIKYIKPNILIITLIIIMTAVSEFLVTHALNFSLVAYVSILKRFSIVWAILLSVFFLKDHIDQKRFIAIVLMFVGAIIIFIS